MLRKPHDGSTGAGRTTLFGRLLWCAALLGGGMTPGGGPLCREAPWSTSMVAWGTAWLC